MPFELLHPDEIDASFVPRARERMATADLDGETVLFHEDTGGLHRLDTIATLVWSRFDGAATVHAITGELADAFQADRAVVEGDVLALVRRLGAEGLLAGVAADPAVVGEEPVTGDAVDYEADARGCA